MYSTSMPSMISVSCIFRHPVWYLVFHFFGDRYFLFGRRRQPDIVHENLAPEVTVRHDLECFGKRPVIERHGSRLYICGHQSKDALAVYDVGGFVLPIVLELLPVAGGLVLPFDKVL